MKEFKNPVTIEVEEYKELLITKGRYEELKDRINNRTHTYIKPSVLYKGSETTLLAKKDILMPKDELKTIREAFMTAATSLGIASENLRKYMEAVSKIDLSHVYLDADVGDSDSYSAERMKDVLTNSKIQVLYCDGEIYQVIRYYDDGTSEDITKEYKEKMEVKDNE